MCKKIRSSNHVVMIADHLNAGGRNVDVEVMPFAAEEDRLEDGFIRLSSRMTGSEGESALPILWVTHDAFGCN